MLASTLLCSAHLPGLQSQFERQFPNKHSSLFHYRFPPQRMDIIKHRNCIYPAGMNSALMAFCRVWQLLFVSNDTHWSSVASGGATTHPQLCPLGFWWKFIIVWYVFPCHVFSQSFHIVMLLTVYVKLLWIFKLWEHSLDFNIIMNEMELLFYDWVSV